MLYYFGTRSSSDIVQGTGDLQQLESFYKQAERMIKFDQSG